MINTSKKLATRIAPALFFVSMAAACGQGASTASDVKITNGIATTASTYPSVVLLGMETDEGEALCTGTFVNDSQVISAGHCVEGLATKNPQVYLVKIASNGQLQAVAQGLSWARDPNYDINNGVAPNDVSIINFPANSAPAVSAIATATPKVGDPFTIVGFGNNVNYETGDGSGSGAGTKRYGSNTVQDVEQGMIAFAGLTGTEKGQQKGTNVSSGEGDSGGPLFINGKIAGVTSGGGAQQASDGSIQDVSLYVDLTSAQSQSFLKKNLKSSTSNSTSSKGRNSTNGH